MRVMVDRSQELIIAARAVADPRTVRKYLSGGEVRGAVVDRIRRAVEDLGVVDQDGEKPRTGNDEAAP